MAGAGIESRHRSVLEDKADRVSDVFLPGTPYWYAPYKRSLQVPPTGASTPFSTYDCDDKSVFTYGNGVREVRGYYRLTSEAINRKCVALGAQGDYIEFEAKSTANSLLLRYSLSANIPREETRSLSVYINGKYANRLRLSPFHIHMERGDSAHNTFNPAAPSVKEQDLWRWWDEASVLGLDINPGDTIRIQKDPSDEAPTYYLDLVDLELVPPPLGKNGTKPDSTWNAVTEFGATPDVPTDDDGPAFIRAIDAAIKDGSKRVWLPPGRFDIDERIVLDSRATGLQFQGSGMWYSTVFMAATHDKTKEAHGIFWVDASDVTFRDFKVDRRANFRRPAADPGNHGGPAFKRNGDRLRLERIWISHAGAGTWYAGANCVFTENRVRTSYADALNLQSSATGCLISNNHIRGSGDDSLAHYCPGSPGKGNIFRNNTIESGYFGRGIMASGTDSDVFENNVVIDQAGTSILIGAIRSPEPMKNTIFRGNVIIRSGGPAIEIRPQHNVIDVTIKNNWIIDSMNDGIYIRRGNPATINIVDNIIIAPAAAHINDASVSGSKVVKNNNKYR